jgi:hypothetical protein
MPTFVVTDGSTGEAFQLSGDKLVGPLSDTDFGGLRGIRELELQNKDPKTFLQDSVAPLYWHVVDAELEAGIYYPRIWRGTMEESTTLPPLQALDHQAFYSGLQQTDILMNDLEALFRVVHPCAQTNDVYGSEIRNLLILACTEVEAQWRAILEANEATSEGKYFCTKDYVKLLEPLKLREYDYRLHRFPGYTMIRPFAAWQPSDSTKSLDWYDAYNAVKHNRENEFSRATLRHAISAVAAVDIMMVAQFGMVPLNLLHAKTSFTATHVPTWLPAERYYPPRPNQQWKRTFCPALTTWGKT